MTYRMMAPMSASPAIVTMASRSWYSGPGLTTSALRLPRRPLFSFAFTAFSRFFSIVFSACSVLFTAILHHYSALSASFCGAALCAFACQYSAFGYSGFVSSVFCAPAFRTSSFCGAALSDSAFGASASGITSFCDAAF